MERQNDNLPGSTGDPDALDENQRDGAAGASDDEEIIKPDPN
jgi:hypothetical protein